MATLATQVERDVAAAWEDQYASGVNSGIVGDAAHRREGGYHISIEDQPSDNYSVIRADDKAPPGTWDRDKAAAIDQSMNAKDMALCYARVFAVWNDKTDPRRRYFNAFNVWDGKSADPVRLDFVLNVKTKATRDHTWHAHGEFRRRYVEDPVAGKAWLSMTGGQSKIDWLMLTLSNAGDNMQRYVREAGTPHVYITDGITLRHVPNPAAFKGLKEMTLDDTVYEIPAGTLANWGVYIGPAVPEAMITSAFVDLDVLADKIAERLLNKKV